MEIDGYDAAKLGREISMSRGMRGVDPWDAELFDAWAAKKSRDLCGVVLQVGVLNDNNLARRLLENCAESRLFPSVASVKEGNKLFVRRVLIAPGN